MSTTMTRRSVLGGALGLLAAAAINQHSTLALAAPPTRRHPLTGQPLTGPQKAYTGPFSVAESSVLSEDYFLTDLVLVDESTSRILPFARSDSSVEALVLAGGRVSHLSRSAGTTSGWTYTLLGDPDFGLILEGVTDAAVATSAAGDVWALFLTPNDSTASSWWGYLAAGSGEWGYTEGGSFPATGLTPLRVGADRTGTPYIYAFPTGSALSDGAKFPVWLLPAATPTPSNPVPGPQTTWYDAPITSDPVADARLLLNTSWDADKPGGILTLTTKQELQWNLQDSATSFSPGSPVDLGPTDRLVWVGWGPETGANGLPNYVLQDSDGSLDFQPNLGNEVAMTTLGSKVGLDQAAVWFVDGLATFAVVDSAAPGGPTLNVLAQYGDAASQDPQFTPAIPIAADIVNAVALPTDAQEATLFVVNGDTTLSVLTKDPTLGVWTNTPVRQASADMQEMSSWRTQLTVTDANGAPVTQTGVRITPDRAVRVWQPTGNTEMDPKNPATMTTDWFGRVTFATPAVELDTAAYAVQVMDGTTLSGDPITARPDADVHAYLAGTGTLNGLSALNGQSLLDAKQSDGTPLFPVLSSITDPSTRQAAAAGVAAAVTQSIAAGQGAPAKAVQAFMLDLSGTVPTYSDSPSPQAFRLVGSSSWWQRAKNDAESAYHSVRHGLIKIEKCTTTWAADTKNWVVNLAITIGDDVSDVISYAITDLKSALHAVCGFFHALGADIEKAYHWLRHNIVGLLKSCSANSKIMQSWLGQLPGVLGGQLQHYENLADNFFRNLEVDYTNEINNLQSKVEKGQTLGQPVTTQGELGSIDLMAVMNDVRHNWLIDKIMGWAGGSFTVPSVSTLQGLGNDLVDVVTTNEQHMETVATEIWHGFEDMIQASLSDAKNMTLDQLFDILRSIGVDLLTFADAIVDELLDAVQEAVRRLGDLVNSPVDGLPLLGPLLRLIGIDDTINPAHLAALLIAYPATLANALSNSNEDLFPTDGDYGPGLKACAAVAQYIWMLMDIPQDVVSQAEPEVEFPAVFTCVDALMPIFLSILLFPGAPNADGTTAAPFVHDPDQDAALAWAGWILGLLPAGVVLLQNGAALLKGGEDAVEPVLPWLNCAFGAGALVVQSVWNFRHNGANEYAKAAGIVGNVTTFTAPLTSEVVAGSTEDISVAVKVILDVACGIGGAVLTTKS